MMLSARRTRTVVPAALVALLLVGGSLGATFSLLRADDLETPSQQPRTGHTVAPGAVPSLASSAVRDLLDGERFHVDLVTAPTAPTAGGLSISRATISGEIDLSTGEGDPERIRTDIAIEFGEGATIELSQIKIGSRTWVKPVGADDYELSKRAKGKDSPPAATAAEVDPVGPLIHAMLDLPRAAFTMSPLPADPGVHLISVAPPPRGSKTRWRSLTLAVDQATGQAKGMMLTRGKMNAVASFSRIGDPSIEIVAPTGT